MNHLTQMLVALAALVLVGFALVIFNRFSVTRYGHRFFSLPILVICAAAAWAVIAGAEMQSLTGHALFVGGAVALLGVGAHNVAKAGPVVGLAGTVPQVALATAVGFLGAAAALPLLLFGVAAVLGGAEPVVRRHFDHDSIS